MSEALRRAQGHGTAEEVWYCTLRNTLDGLTEVQQGRIKLTDKRVICLLAETACHLLELGIRQEYPTAISDEGRKMQGALADLTDTVGIT